MEGESSINRSFCRRRRGEEERRERERRKKRRKERKKKRKRKRKKERGKRPTVSYSVYWHSDDRNSLNQRVKSGDSKRGYASRCRDSSYFGLLIAFGLLFLG